MLKKNHTALLQLLLMTYLKISDAGTNRKQRLLYYKLDLKHTKNIFKNTIYVYRSAVVSKV